MIKSIYYVQCTAKTDFSYKCGYQKDEYVHFHKGDIFYYNRKTTARDMNVSYAINNYKSISSWSYLPFTRTKTWAKKWEVKHYADRIANIINSIGQFDAVVKEIKVTYEEEEA